MANKNPKSFKKIAVIGGGLAGIVAAQKLNPIAKISVFEKARGAGGRMSTRRAEPYQFDHGAQYFTARSDRFKAFLRPHLESGLIKDWDAKVVSLEKGKKPYKREWFEPHYVCAPRMNSLCKTIAEDLSTSFRVEITKLQRNGDAWLLHDKDDQTHGPFDWVIMSIPSHQAVNLLPDEFAHLDHIAQVQMTGCYSVMLGFEDAPRLNWDIAIPKDSLIGWMALNSSKPERETAPSIMIQTTNKWAEAHIDDDVEAMQALIIQEFCALSSISGDLIAHKATHRWRYANTAQPAVQNYFLDDALKIGVCGDWCIKGRIESAFLSADQLCAAIISNHF